MQEEKSHLSQLFSLKDQINNKVDRLQKLNNQYGEKQQKIFLKTFLSIMDHMSNQLLEQQELYKNVDEEINRDPDCVRLKQKLDFYKNQCLNLKYQLETTQKQLDEYKNRGKYFEKTNEKLHKDLFISSKKETMYRTKTFSLQTKMRQSFSKNKRYSLTKQ